MRCTQGWQYLIEGLLVCGIGLGGKNDVACIGVADLYIMLQGHLVDRLALARRNTQRLT